MKKRLKVHRRMVLRVVLGLFVLPPILWGVALAIVPTDCARLSIAKRLSASSGRPVTLGRVRVGFLGGVSLSDLRIGAPGNADQPWLMIDKATIDVSLLQLLFGTIEPRRIDVAGLFLRIHRRPDGSLELADLLSPDPSGAERAMEESSATHERANLEVLVRDAKIQVLDESSGTKLEFTSVACRGVCNGIQTRVQELRGNLHGGTVELAAQVDRAGKGPVFEGQVRMREVALDPGMKALAYLTPVFAGMNSHLEGKLNLDLYAQGQGDSHATLARTIVGNGRIDIDPLVFEGSKLLEKVGKIVELSPRGRVGSVHADLTIRNGRVSTEHLTLDVAPTPLVFAGFTDFEGRVSYRLRTDGLTDKLPSQAREILSELAIEVDDLTDVRFEGSLEAIHVTFGGVPIDENGHDPKRDEHAKLREISRRLRERVRR